MKGPGIVACILGFFSRGWAGVVVNEVLYDPPGDDSELERIELYNNGSAAVNLAGWELCPASTPYYRFPIFTLQPGTWVVVHLREGGTDTSTDRFEGMGSTQNRRNRSGSVALFDNSYNSASTPVDFMEYGAGGQTCESAAVQDSLWPGFISRTWPEGWCAGSWTRNKIGSTRSVVWDEGSAPGERSWRWGCMCSI